MKKAIITPIIAALVLGCATARPSKEDQERADELVKEAIEHYDMARRDDKDMQEMLESAKAPSIKDYVLKPSQVCVSKIKEALEVHTMKEGKPIYAYSENSSVPTKRGNEEKPLKEIREECQKWIGMANAKLGNAGFCEQARVLMNKRPGIKGVSIVVRDGGFPKDANGPADLIWEETDCGDMPKKPEIPNAMAEVKKDVTKLCGKHVYDFERNSWQRERETDSLTYYDWNAFRCWRKAGKK